MELIKITQEMNFEDFKELMLQAIEGAGSIMPVFSSIMNFWEHRNFKKRILKCENQIKQILLSIPNGNAEFFYTKVAPLVFEKIMKDHEDEKTEFLLLGFDNCVKNEISSYDEILFYFDLISNLRVMELKRFLSFTTLTGENPIVASKGSVQEMLLQRADYKLNELNLLYFGIPTGKGDFMRMEVQGENTKHSLDKNNRASLTTTGENLLKFIGYRI